MASQRCFVEIEMIHVLMLPVRLFTLITLAYVPHSFLSLVSPEY